MIWHFGISLGQWRTDGWEYALSLRPITGAGFWKNKTLWQTWWRFSTITMPKSVSEACALCKNIRMTFQYSNVFLCEIFSFILVLGLILVKTAVLAKDINCVFLHRKSYTSQPELNQTIIAYQTFNQQGMMNKNSRVLR